MCASRTVILPDPKGSSISMLPSPFSRPATLWFFKNDASLRTAARAILAIHILREFAGRSENCSREPELKVRVVLTSSTNQCAHRRRMLAVKSEAIPRMIRSSSAS